MKAFSYQPQIFFDIMKVVTTNNDIYHHHCTVASASKNPAYDRNISSKGTFLIYIGTCNSLSGSLEAQSWLSIKNSFLPFQAFSPFPTFPSTETPWASIETPSWFVPPWLKSGLKKWAVEIYTLQYSKPLLKFLPT